MAILTDNLLNAAFAFLAAGVIPTYLGLSLLVLMTKKSSEAHGKFIASIASGISFALFFDLVGDASALGLNLGLSGSSTQVLLIGSFVIGLVMLFALETKVGMQDQVIPVAISYVIAMGVGFHSFAEGIVVGYDIRIIGLPEDLTTAFQALSFALHKAGEGVVIASLFITRIGWRKILETGAIASLPGVLGAILGTFGISGVVSSYFFAMGAGASIYIIAKLLPEVVSRRNNITVALGLVIGYLFIYGAGIIHTI